jgi:hypothetical protein
METLRRDNLRRGARKLARWQAVRFHHGHDADREHAAQNDEADIPGHRWCLLSAMTDFTGTANNDVTAVTKHRFYRATALLLYDAPRARSGYSAAAGYRA